MRSDFFQHCFSLYYFQYFFEWAPRCIGRFRNALHDARLVPRRVHTLRHLLAFVKQQFSLEFIMRFQWSRFSDFLASLLHAALYN